MIELPRYRLRRFYGQGDRHFITSSCYRRKPLLGTAHARGVFLELLEEVRRRFCFDVIGYVVMPEHVHLLLGEPEKGNPSRVMQVLKQARIASTLGETEEKRLLPNGIVERPSLFWVTSASLDSMTSMSSPKPSSCRN